MDHKTVSVGIVLIATIFYTIVIPPEHLNTDITVKIEHSKTNEVIVRAKFC